ncbi:hypothetical protein [Nocardia flavorosea]|uniref:Uncharacterized protein n=1 Tax=Nocardia flavorosea TaxID=53429 RepID=A0A846YSI3_9NOCA|nr:hypothetical protein [Nocardia flavorosea]NKY60444.1 hypothetical protein [Nocardia flavorosea]
MSEDLGAWRVRMQEHGKQVRDLAVEIVRVGAEDARLDELARACYEFYDAHQPPAWPDWNDAEPAMRDRYVNKAVDLLKLEGLVQGKRQWPSV